MTSKLFIAELETESPSVVIEKEKKKKSATTEKLIPLTVYFK